MNQIVLKGSRKIAKGSQRETKGEQKHQKKYFVRFGASGLSEPYIARRELSIDVLDVGRASIYAELRPKQVCMQIVWKLNA